MFFHGQKLNKHKQNNKYQQMSAEKVTLNWNDFESSAGLAFKQLWIDQHFTDVTLVTEDSQQIEAHKAIISSCSPFFKKILLRNPHQNPLLYLKDIDHIELGCLMEFMYLGQTCVEESYLDKFLATARSLGIFGLVNKYTSEDVLTEEKTEDVTNVKEEECKEIEKEDKHMYDCKECEKTFAFNNMLVKHSKQHHALSVTQTNAAIMNQVNYGITNYACNSCGKKFTAKRYLDKHRKSVHDEVEKYCNQCDYSCARTDTLKIHKQSKHDGVRYSCPDCDTVFSTNGSLITHKKVKHEGRRFNCDQCHHKSTHLKYLKSHKMSKHSFIANQ